MLSLVLPAALLLFTSSTAAVVMKQFLHVTASDDDLVASPAIHRAVLAHPQHQNRISCNVCLHSAATTMVHVRLIP